MDFLKDTLNAIHPRSLKHLSHQLNGLLKNHLWAKVLFGFLAGILLGIALTPTVGWVTPSIANTISEWLAFPGQLFLRLVQMIVIPLIFASVIRGVASGENIEQLKKLGLRVALYFFSTTAIAIVIGLFCVNLIRPGSLIDSSKLQGEATSRKETVSTLEMEAQSSEAQKRPLPSRVINLLPQNPLVAMSDSNMLQVVIFSLIVGFALITMQASEARSLIELLGSLQAVCMTVVKWAMLLAPLAVFGLTTKMVASVGLDSLVGLGAYVGTVLTALFLIMVFYLALVFFIGKRNPIAFIKTTFNTQLLAFSTSSSAAVMPLSIQTAEEGLKIKPSISQFVIPLGTTINMAGTAAYQMIATVFLAQVFQIELNTGQLALVGITAIGASVGSPGAPGVGIVILATILRSVGIPLSGTALIIAVDRILDMSRTSVNVLGDLTACAVMDQLLSDDQNELSSTPKSTPKIIS